MNEMKKKIDFITSKGLLLTEKNGNLMTCLIREGFNGNLIYKEER